MKTHMEVNGVVADIDLLAIPHNDPIAYAFGFMQGLSGESRSKPERGEKLAEGYVKGFAHGRRVRGCLPVRRAEEPPAWAKIIKVPKEGQP